MKLIASHGVYSHERSICPCAVLATGIDGGRPLCANRKLRWIGIVEIDFHRILALGGACRRLLKLRNVVAWEKLAYAVAAPDLVNPSIENLTCIKVERDLDRWPAFSYFRFSWKNVAST